MAKYIKIVNGNIPVIIADGNKAFYNNALVDVTPEVASALGYKPLIDNPPEVGQMQIARVVGYTDNGDSMTANYVVIDYTNATLEELRDIIKNFDTSDMSNYTKTDLLKVLAALAKERQL